MEQPPVQVRTDEAGPPMQTPETIHGQTKFEDQVMSMISQFEKLFLSLMPTRYSSKCRGTLDKLEDLVLLKHDFHHTQVKQHVTVFVSNMSQSVPFVGESQSSLIDVEELWQSENQNFGIASQLSSSFERVEKSDEEILDTLLDVQIIDTRMGDDKSGKVIMDNTGDDEKSNKEIVDTTLDDEKPNEKSSDKATKESIPFEYKREKKLVRSYEEVQCRIH